MQFGGFLASQLGAAEYDARLPALAVLGQTYHLTPDAAFFLSRPMFVHQIQVSTMCQLRVSKLRCCYTVKLFRETCSRKFHDAIASCNMVAETLGAVARVGCCSTFRETS